MGRKIIVKCVAFLLLLSLMCISFSGCSLFASVAELLVPPALSRENAQLKAAFEEACGEGVKYKSPVSGNYLSSFVVEDFDADGDEEALVFYAEDMFSDSLRMAVMEYTDNGWIYITSMDGSGSDVYSLELIDLDNDDLQEVVICWSSQDADNRTMSIYSYEADPFSLTRIFSTSYAQMLLADLDADGQKEIFLVVVSNVLGNRTNLASVLTKTANGINFLDKQYIDSEVRSYEDIFVVPNENGSTLYMDAYKSGTQMVTEIMIWNGESKTLTVPFIDSDTMTNTATWRAENIPCRDLDGDGLPEIPCQTELPLSEVWRSEIKLKTPMYITTWRSFRENMLEPFAQTVMNVDANFLFFVPENWQNRFTVTSYTGKNKWNFYETVGDSGDEVYLFSIVFSGASTTVHEEDYNSLTELCSNGENKLYCYGINKNSNLQVSETLLKQCFEYLN